MSANTKVLRRINVEQMIEDFEALSFDEKVENYGYGWENYINDLYAELESIKSDDLQENEEYSQSDYERDIEDLEVLFKFATTNEKYDLVEARKIKKRLSKIFESLRDKNI